MTVTIKKNVDVQATVEATQLKYQVKRDLSGDVQFTNCTNVGILNCQSTGGGGTDVTVSTGTTAGFNFFKIPKVRLKVYSSSTLATGSFKFKANGVTKLSSRLTGVTYTTTTTTVTPTTPTVTLAGASPNILTLVITKNTITSVWATMVSQAQRNQKATIMK